MTHYAHVVTMVVPTSYIDEGNAFAHSKGDEADSGTYGRGIIFDHPKVPFEGHVSSERMTAEELDALLNGMVPGTPNENADAAKAEAFLNICVFYRAEDTAPPKISGNVVTVIVDRDPLSTLAELGFVRRVVEEPI